MLSVDSTRGIQRILTGLKESISVIDAQGNAFYNLVVFIMCCSPIQPFEETTPCHELNSAAKAQRVSKMLWWHKQG